MKNRNNKQKDIGQIKKCPSAKTVNEKEMFSLRDDCPKDNIRNQEENKNN